MTETRYTTRQDAIEQAIMPALTEGAYDYEAICREAFTWKIDTNYEGQELLNTGGFEQTVTDEEFWEIAAKHETTDALADHLDRVADGDHETEDWVRRDSEELDYADESDNV